MARIAADRGLAIESGGARVEAVTVEVAIVEAASGAKSRMKTFI